MKKVLILTLLVVLSIPVMSQGKKYTKAMLSAIEKMNEASDPATELELANTFEELAMNYPDQWLPSYHASMIVIISSFSEPDGGKSDALLDRAKKSLDIVMEKVPGESEAHVLKSFYYIGVMSVDPATRGQLYYEDVLDGIHKSKSLNPDNPRAWYMDGMMTSNLPEFIGGGPAAAKPLFLVAVKKFGEFQNEDPLWPTWGKDLVQDELAKLKDVQLPAEE